MGNLTEDNFDVALRCALCKHSEPVPADFVEKMLRRAREAEQKRIVARVLLQERVALGVSLAVPVVAVVLAIVFQGFAVIFLSELAGHADSIARIIIRSVNSSYLWAVFAVFFGAALYGAMELCLGQD